GMPEEAAFPRSLKIFTPIHLASGATPTEVPPASPPTMTPIVHVPWPLTSVGGDGFSRLGSYQLFDPPRQRLARSGWVTSTPVSMLATTTPWPRYPISQRAGASILARFASEAATVVSDAIACGAWNVRSGWICLTSDRVASSAITSGVATTSIPL